MSATPEELRVMLADVLAGIAPEADFDSLEPNKPYREQLDLDSMDFLSLLDAIETRTGVNIPEADYRKVLTLDGLIAYLQERGGASAG